MEIKGKIVATPPAKSGSSARGTWKKAFIVVEYESGQYPKRIMLSNMKNADDFARLSVGQTGTFKYDHKVDERNGQFFMDTTCWGWSIDQQIGYGNDPI